MRAYLHRLPWRKIASAWSSTMKGDEMIDAPQPSPVGITNDASGKRGYSTPASVGSVDNNDPRPDERASADAVSIGHPQSSPSLKRWVKAILSKLPSDGHVRISLNDGTSTWAMGDADATIVGIAIESTARSIPLKLSSFMLNKRELDFVTYSACDEIRVEICVCCINDMIRGQVDLPLGANVTFQSAVDRSTLMGLSSFALSFCA